MKYSADSIKEDLNKEVETEWYEDPDLYEDVELTQREIPSAEAQRIQAALESNMPKSNDSIGYGLGGIQAHQDYESYQAEIISKESYNIISEKLDKDATVEQKLQAIEDFRDKTLKSMDDINTRGFLRQTASKFGISNKEIDNYLMSKPA